MSKRIVDKKHLEYVGSLPCFISKSGFMSCVGPIQVHHLLKPSDNKRGWSLKAGDNQVIPLCMFHHAQLHTKFGNEFKFLKHYGFKQNAAQEYAKTLWENKQDYYEIDDDLPF
tara:strand:+ start:1276 stop:1614 length:339 start_codon:yes stop_codon:yes gene_type:complete